MNYNKEGIKEVFFILVKKIWAKLANKVINVLNVCLPDKAKIKNISFNLNVIGCPTTRAAIDRLMEWKDPTWEDFEHIRIVDKEKGVEQANYERTFVGLGDYNKVTDFILSIQYKFTTGSFVTPAQQSGLI